MLTGNAGYGINSAGAQVIATGNRLRNTTGNITGIGNYPTGYNYVAAGVDADEYNDAANGDYRIKATAAFANRGIGVSQMPAAASGSRRVLRGSVIGGLLR